MHEMQLMSNLLMVLVTSPSESCFRSDFIITLDVLMKPARIGYLWSAHKRFDGKFLLQLYVAANTSTLKLFFKYEVTNCRDHLDLRISIHSYGFTPPCSSFSPVDTSFHAFIRIRLLERNDEPSGERITVIL